MKKILVYLLFAISFFSLSACSSSPGEKIDNVVWTDSQGRTMSVNELRGQWIVLNYWAAWCRPCLVEMPDLETLHNKYHNVVVVGINYDDWDDAQLNQFAEEWNITYSLIRPDISAQLGIDRLPGLPTTYFIDPEGYLRGPLVGEKSLKQFESFMGL